MTLAAELFKGFDVKECLTLYLQKRHDKICQVLYEVFKYCNTMVYSRFSLEDLKEINSFVEFVFFLLAQEDFRFTEKWVHFFVNVNHLFSNLVTISGYKNSDGVIRSIVNQQGNYVKLLFLQNCRSKVDLDLEMLIAPNPRLATLWWNNYLTPTVGETSEHIHRQMVRHYEDYPKNLVLPDIRVEPGYFHCSYTGVDERPLKEFFNKQVRRFANKVKIKHRNKKGRIAIITDKWTPITAVYKSSYPQIAALAKKYDLTLIHSSKAEVDHMDTSLFKRVFQVGFALDKLDTSVIANNDFQLAYFPDIGMTDESVFMSNIKVAPIMVCGYGHPVSTYGSLVDYFIGGSDSELPELHKENYSERLVLIPGLGAHPVDPQYTKKYPPATDKVYINCCWTTAKISWPMLQMLRRIQKEASVKVHYQFFPSWTGTRYNGFTIMTQEIGEIFQGNVTVFPNLPYQDYLENMERASLSIDSYPFGGYNTVVDSLFVGCPVVTIEGTKFQNRASSALAKRVGVDLSTSSIEECEKKVLSLLNNPEQLKQERVKLDDVDRLRKLLLDTDEPEYFVKAIDHIIANHPIPGTEPIVIK